MFPNAQVDGIFTKFQPYLRVIPTSLIKSKLYCLEKSAFNQNDALFSQCLIFIVPHDPVTDFRKDLFLHRNCVLSTRLMSSVSSKIRSSSVTSFLFLSLKEGNLSLKEGWFF